MKYYFYYDFPIGRVGIAEANGSIVQVFFANAEDSTFIKQVTTEFELKESPLLKKASKEFKEYFAGCRREFELPLTFNGTDFQKQVWKALLEIPYGETRTYGEIAAYIGNPKGCRAVGMANNRNPIAIICPCHRVIGADGSLVGYGGGLATKKILLDLEKGIC